MAYAPVVVLQLPLSDPALLEPFVEACLDDCVDLIAVWGESCEAVEEEVDWIIVGDGSDPDRFITTSAHPGESLEETLEMARSWRVEGRVGVEIVRL